MSNRFKPGVFTRAAVAGVLAAGLIPCAAFAGSSDGDESSDGEVSSVVASMADKGYELLDAFVTTGNANVLSSSNKSGDSADATLDAAWPSSFDLRNNGTITPVKSQIPWGTCWSFSAIATAETSILNELGLTYDEFHLDLSERQLAWFSQTVLPEGSGSQAGEGSTATDPDNRLNVGGMQFTATSILASGIGPVTEKEVPYKNNDGTTQSFRQVYGNERAEAMKKENPSFDVDGPDCYASTGDWSVDESYRFQSVLQLENGFFLPSPATIAKTMRMQEDGTVENAVTYTYNENGTAAIKQQLLAGNAVSASFYADAYRPGQTDPAEYINVATWAHYTDEPLYANHAVTIVGWDDNYSKTNFLEGHQPPRNGAWIVKNSWGSNTEEFPNNNGGWGVDGEGYFYLSYFDQSLTDLEVFDFDTTSLDSDDDHYIVDSYSYMPSSQVMGTTSENFVQMANVFTAEEDQVLRYVSSETASDNMSVTYDIYLLDDDAASPTDGKHVASTSDSYQYNGFHRTALSSGVVLKKGQRYSVAVTMRTVDGQYQFIMPAGLSQEAAKAKKMSSYSTAVVNEGESALYSDGKWQDWTKVIADTTDKLRKECEQQGLPDTSGYYTFDNLPVRAYSDPYTTPTFSDVASDDWFAAAVAKVADARLMTGYAGTDIFGVGRALTRAELATILWRDANPACAESYDGAAANSTGMADVAENKFYTAAADWAVAGQIIEGVEHADGTRTFEPDRAVTFEEAVKIIARYAKAVRGADISADESVLDPFADGASVDAWARPYMAWAVSSGLVKGYPTDEGAVISPASDLPRERAAEVISRSMDKGFIG